MTRLWLLVIGLTIATGCNVGQCIRQSDCPMGSSCKQGICRLPPKAEQAQSPATPLTLPDEPMTPDTDMNAVALSEIVDAGTDTGTTL